MIYLFCGCIFFGWLIPNHYFPWLSAWNEATSITGLLLMAIYLLYSSRSASAQISGLPLTFFCLIFTLPWLQLAVGHLIFAGDAVMVGLYAACALLAVCIGYMLNRSPEAFAALMTACTLAAIASTGIALVQWTGALSLGIYGADLPPGGRPFGNVAQPNHLSTLCFLGICALCWLYEQHKTDTAAWIAGSLFLLGGMLLSQSRTGWLQIALLVVWGCVQYVRMHNRVSLRHLLLLGSIFIAGVLLWQSLNELLLLDAGRDLSGQMRAGSRPVYWLLALDALWQQPWWGYGWQQIGAAQQAAALNHPPLAEYFEHSHNLVLDLMLWNGIPLGLLLTALMAIWLYRQIRHYTTPQTGWLLAALMGLGIHGMLEFPLEYAYFLIPAALLIGGVEASTLSANTSWVRVPRSVLAGGIVAIAATAIAVAGEWLEAEANYRTLRFESARIGESHTHSEAPDFRLLTQLSAFLTFARTEAAPDISTEQVEWMRQVSTRFGYPPVLFRYALAAGLSGNHQQAALTLQRICYIHGIKRCAEAQEGWLLLQHKYPQLRSVPAPYTPKLLISVPSPRS